MIYLIKYGTHGTTIVINSDSVSFSFLSVLEVYKKLSHNICVIIYYIEIISFSIHMGGLIYVQILMEWVFFSVVFFPFFSFAPFSKFLYYMIDFRQ